MCATEFSQYTWAHFVCFLPKKFPQPYLQVVLSCTFVDSVTVVLAGCARQLATTCHGLSQVLRLSGLFYSGGVCLFHQHCLRYRRKESFTCYAIWKLVLWVWSVSSESQFMLHWSVPGRLCVYSWNTIPGSLRWQNRHPSLQIDIHIYSIANILKYCLHMVEVCKG